MKSLGGVTAGLLSLLLLLASLAGFIAPYSFREQHRDAPNAPALSALLTTHYGVDPAAPPEGADHLSWLQESLVDHMPESHRRFFETLHASHTEGDYLFVHAGIRPGLPLEGQDLDDLLWIREPFLSSDEDFGKIVVHGHTPTDQPEVRVNRIGLDTGAVYGGKLTALVLEGSARRFLQV